MEAETHQVPYRFRLTELARMRWGSIQTNHRSHTLLILGCRKTRRQRHKTA